MAEYKVTGWARVEIECYIEADSPEQAMERSKIEGDWETEMDEAHPERAIEICEYCSQPIGKPHLKRCRNKK